MTAPQAAGSGASIQARIGTILLVRVLGDAKESLSLESFFAPRFAENPPLALEARFRNQGTLHESPAGEIEVRNIFGALVATGTLPVRNVLPGVVRKVEASVGQGFWLGKYTVSLRASYGDAERQLAASSVVWVVPWQALWPWTLLAGVVIALGFVARRRFAAAWHVLRTGKERAA